MSRIDRLRASLEEGLLVSNGQNVRYLTGFESSNAALLVEPERVRLFSDFRYAEAGRAVAGVEFVETKRDLYADLAGRLSGRIGFEAADLTYERWETLVGGGLVLVARSGLVERLRSIKDDAELAAIGRAVQSADRGLGRLVQEPFVGKTEAELAWMLERFIHEEGGEGLAFEIG
ncbi:MAG: M24 family metallopeptidase, partial [Gaiellaceae bacterium]